MFNQYENIPHSFFFPPIVYYYQVTMVFHLSRAEISNFTTGYGFRSRSAEIISIILAN
jgi:hypothetical protein